MALTTLAKTPLRALLGSDAVLRRLAFEIRENHFHALELSLPLSHGFVCPLGRQTDFFSFSEIFILGEYGDFLEHMPLPRRWLDLGCHVGYFSLYVAWQHAVRGSGQVCEALLVDADPGTMEQARRTLSANQGAHRFNVRHGAIAEAGKEVMMWLQPYMSSSMFPVASSGARQVTVPVISVDDIFRQLPPPYDLVKLDIEGGETDFLQAYGAVLQESHHVLLEWHTWNRRQWDEAAISRRIRSEGFLLVKRIKPPTSLVIDGKVYYSGVDLFRRST